MTRRWVAVWLVSQFLLFGFIAGLAAILWQQRLALDSLSSQVRSFSTELDAQGRRLDDVDWYQQFDEIENTTDQISTEVGTIQFLKRGFS
jgi:hypothetical protein